MSLDALQALYTRFGRNYPKGSVIFLEGDRGEEMFLLIGGKVEISKKIPKTESVGKGKVSEAAESKVLARLGPGDIFGEMALIDERPRSATAFAMDDCKMVVIDRNNLKIIIEKRAEFAYKMLLVLSGRLRSLDEQLERMQQLVEGGGRVVETAPKETVKASEPEAPKPEAVKISAPEPAPVVQAPSMPSLSPKEQFLQLSEGFISSMTLFTALRLDVFANLDLKPCTVEELSAAIKCDPYGLQLLLNALVSQSVLMKDAGAFSNTTSASKFLVKDKFDYLGNWFETLEKGWNEWSKLFQAVKDGKVEGAPNKSAFIRGFVQGKNVDAFEVVDQLMRSKDFSAAKRMVETGENPAAYAIEIAKQLDKVSCVVMDTEAGLKVTDDYIAQFGLGDRVIGQVGNYEDANFGKNYDLMVAAFILHGKDAAAAKNTIVKAEDALNTNGWLVIHDYILTEDGTSPSEALTFALDLYLCGDGARVYTLPEVSAWLKEAGFQNVTKQQLPDSTYLITAQKA